MAKGEFLLIGDYYEVHMIVYDIIVAEERQRVAKKGRIFDEGIYLVEEFSPKEMGIIST